MNNKSQHTHCGDCASSDTLKRNAEKNNFTPVCVECRNEKLSRRLREMLQWTVSQRTGLLLSFCEMYSQRIGCCYTSGLS